MCTTLFQWKILLQEKKSGIFRACGPPSMGKLELKEFMKHSRNIFSIENFCPLPSPRPHSFL